MARLYVRLYLLAAGLLLATIISQWYEENFLEHWWPQSESSAQTAFALVNHQLAKVPMAQWPDEMAALRRIAPGLQPLARVDEMLARKGFLLSEVGNLRAGKFVFWNGDDYSTHIAMRIGDSPYAEEIMLRDQMPRVFLLWLNMTVMQLIVAAVAMWFWVRPFWHDLQGLDAGVSALAAGNFNYRIHIRRRAIMHPLAQSFNWMAERIGALLASHRALTNAVSHELRTPLARLRFALALALRERDPAAKDRQLARMRCDLDELDALANELLTLAKLERTMAGSMSGDAFPAREWLEDRLGEARETAQAMGYRATLRGEAHIESLFGSPHYLARAFDNVVNNAMRYARKEVVVAVEVLRGQALIRVDDDGPGIPETDRARVFEPFVRLDASRDRGSGGVGLGLSIVRQIARAHGGDCVVETSPQRGARVVLSWPIPAKA